MERIATITPVSYTHLDVYKRQAVTYATQKIIRQSNVTERSLVTTCRLLNASRSDDKMCIRDSTEGIDEELLLASIGRRTQDGTLRPAQEVPAAAPTEEEMCIRDRLNYIRR